MRRPRVEGCRWERSKVSRVNPFFQRLSLIDVNTGQHLGRLVMNREGWFVLVEEGPMTDDDYALRPNGHEHGAEARNWNKAHFTRRNRAARALAAAVGRRIDVETSE